MKNNWGKLVFSLAICQLAGIIGSLFTTSAIGTWYSHLHKPSFNPPNWIFAPVWLTLFVLMGVAIFLIWRKGLKDKTRRFVFVLFMIHLGLNALWSIVFFGLHDTFLALLVIIALWGMILMLTLVFSKINKISAYLMLPYLLWVTFASLLNFSIWLIN